MKLALFRPRGFPLKLRSYVSLFCDRELLRGLLSRAYQRLSRRVNGHQSKYIKSFTTVWMSAEKLSLLEDGVAVTVDILYLCPKQLVELYETHKKFD